MGESIISKQSPRRVGSADPLFRFILSASGGAMVLLLLSLFLTLLIASLPAFKTFGFSFFTGTDWDPVNNTFGALPFFTGTIATSFLAVCISLPFSLSVSIFLGEFFKTGPISVFLRSVIELMAGIPSVIYGFWGITFIVPLVREIQMATGTLPYGVSILAAAFVLAIMIIPYSASLAREVISMVPVPVKEAAYSLGSTRFEVVRKVILPYAGSGITAGVLLSLGRAIGETMAVTMLIGNMNKMPTSILGPANTMASIIANEFNEASGGVKLAALMEIALILFILSLLLNLTGKMIITKMQKI